MSLPLTILEYALNQTWDNAIYHLRISLKNLVFIIRKITYVRSWGKEKYIVYENVKQQRI